MQIQSSYYDYCFQERKTKVQSIRKFSVFLAVFLLIPVALQTFILVQGNAEILMLKKEIVFVTALLCGLSYTRFLQRFKKTWLLLCASVALLHVVTICIPLIVHAIEGNRLDWKVVTDAGFSDSWHTLRIMFGIKMITIVFGALFVLHALNTLVLYRFSKNLPSHNFRKLSSTALLCSIVFLSNSQQFETSTVTADNNLHKAASVKTVDTSNSDTEHEEWDQDRRVVHSIQPPNKFKTRSQEDIIIVQMESVNALATNGYGSQEEEEYAYKKYMPTLTRIAKENGIFMPMFWGNSMQTHRAMVTMLCGIVNNMHSAIPGQMFRLRTTCLPDLLAKASYKNFYYSSYHDPKFQSKHKFTEETGFHERYWSDYMSHPDRWYKWGYDDCGYYKKTVQHLLENKGKQPTFAYISVSSHHVPFTPKTEYANKYTKPTNDDPLSKYLNSQSHQDYCLGKFMEAIEPLRDNAHIFILSDHSYPVGFNGSTNQTIGGTTDNFLIPFAYIPPKRRAHQFRIGEVLDGRHYSQADLIPTIFDLLNGKNYDNSFAFALRKKPSQFIANNPEAQYEKCHVLTQPYTNTVLSVVHGLQKYNYTFKTGKLEYVDLRKDLLEQNPVLIATQLPYKEFAKRYYCKRYQSMI